MYVCDICEKPFCQKQSLSRHKREVVCRKGGKFYNPLKCPESNCGMTFNRYAIFRDHLQMHDVHIEFERLVFSSYEAFYSWKRKTELESSSLYRVLSHNGLKKSFVCHRSGFYKSKNSRERKLKSQGSNKMNATCPSLMEVEERDGLLYLSFWKTHYGHSDNVGRIPLSRDERIMVSNKIADGVPLDLILDDIRKNIQYVNDPLALISRKDLHNIKRDFKLQQSVRRHPPEYMNIYDWIRKVEKLPKEENPILCFEDEPNFFLVIANNMQRKILKRYGNDKVCIHSISAYDYHLTTVLVIDEVGIGFPASFCISHSGGLLTWRYFFQKLKENIGTFTPQMFMSDDGMSFYDAWEEVMAPTEQRISSWHVDMIWKEQIDAKVKGSQERKATIYKKLKQLHYEKNFHIFEEGLAELTSNLLLDSKKKDFYKYFTQNFVNRKNLWAHCYRKCGGTNIDNFLENYHKTLKHNYLNPRKNKLKNIPIDNLMKLTRDKMFDRLIQITKRKCTKEEEITSRNHRLGMNIQVEDITEQNENLWIVKSRGKFNLEYEINKSKQNCEDGNCSLKCKECYACIHIFHCQCADYLINQHICKHIHACSIFSTATRSHLVSSTNPDLGQLEGSLWNKDVEVGQESYGNIVQIIEDKLEEAKDLINSEQYSMSDIQEFEKTLDVGLQILLKNKKQITKNDSEKIVYLNKLLVHSDFDHNY